MCVVLQHRGQHATKIISVSISLVQKGRTIVKFELAVIGLTQPKKIHFQGTDSTRISPGNLGVLSLSRSRFPGFKIEISCLYIQRERTLVLVAHC